MTSINKKAKLIIFEKMKFDFQEVGQGKDRERNPAKNM